MKRVFMVSYRKLSSNSGGSAGVNYRLYEYNEKLKEFDNLINIFQDGYCKDGVINYFSGDAPENTTDHEKKLRLNTLRILNRLLIFPALVYCRRLFKAKRWIKMINKNMRFSEEDIFILHDMETAYALESLKKFKFFVVYHQQGTLYSEWKSLNGNKSWLLKHLMEYVQRVVFHDAAIIGFPSNGAMEMLISMLGSSKYSEEIRQKSRILYNGFDAPLELKNTEYADNILSSIPHDIKVFITISTLSKHKGVDRIPDFLGNIKKNGVKFKWILIGDGTEYRNIERKIEENEIQDDVIWERGIVSHNNILKLMERADYYVLLHRISIFDFSTIEAMSYGTVPILSYVGGNKELIEDGVSGFFIDGKGDYYKFLSCRNEREYLEMKANCLIQQRKFNAYNFLLGYYELASLAMEKNG